MSGKTDRAIAIGGFVALLFLHLDFWRPQRAQLYFDWVPEELLYRWLWMGLAGLYILFFCARVWRSEQDEQEEDG